MVANANNASQAASPHSESYGPGVLQMVVDNVLSGSPASVNAKFGPPSTRGEVSLRIIDGKNEEKRNESGPVGLPIPYGVPMFNPPGVEAQGGTPDFQMAPFLFQGGHVIGSNTTMPFGSGSPAAPTFSYGAWSGMYPPHQAPTTSSSDDCLKKTGGMPLGGPGTVSTNMFSTSPPFPYQNPMLGVTNNLSNLSIGGPQITSPLRPDQPFPGGSNALPSLTAPHMMYMQYNQSNPQTPTLGNSPTFFGWDKPVKIDMALLLRKVIVYDCDVAGNVLRYAQHKFASNVIEKCLICAGSHHKTLLIDEVCGTPNDPQPPILLMMKDQFANYVVQKMLDIADPVYRKKMMYAIKPHIPVLRKYSYGKHIITKLEKYFQKQQYNHAQHQHPQYDISGMQVANVNPAVM
ncbi:RNA binding repeat protein, Pumilio-family [Oesophagostomum dentatum]|uniref:RNA binding repeat protein, Pumilio-family n=1 Tax=Oesophagostomum dentatum TaxID=61180 RepID=A0A0B1SXF6_OESDE|nr:RNA binding repeat protein, Pumilio-family [Oesophagostomum dentatum]